MSACETSLSLNHLGSQLSTSFMTDSYFPALPVWMSIPFWEKRWLQTPPECARHHWQNFSLALSRVAMTGKLGCCIGGNWCLTCKVFWCGKIEVMRLIGLRVTLMKEQDHLLHVM